jgi:hypothetical protein
MTHAGDGAASTVDISEAERVPVAAALAALSLLQLRLKGLLSPNSAAVTDSAKATAVVRADTRLRSLPS